MIVITQLKGNLNNYVIEDDVIDLTDNNFAYLICFKGFEILENYFRGKGLKDGFVNVNF